MDLSKLDLSHATEEDHKVVDTAKKLHWLFFHASVLMMVMTAVPTFVFILETINPMAMRDKLTPRKAALNLKLELLNLPLLDTDHVSMSHTGLVPLGVMAGFLTFGTVLGLMSIYVTLQFDDKLLKVVLGTVVVNAVCCLTVCSRMLIYSPHLTLIHLNENLHGNEGIADRSDTGVFWNSIMIYDKCCGITSHHDFVIFAKWNHGKKEFIIGSNKTKLYVKHMESSLACCKDKAFDRAEAGHIDHLWGCASAKNEHMIHGGRCFEIGKALIKDLWQSTVIWCMMLMAMTGMGIYMLMGVLLHFSLHRLDCLTQTLAATAIAHHHRKAKLGHV